ncbi:MAG: PPC domain-containing protein [Planctomycetes bacterium]|nr:PPC domain-containing protein [Planctomycetota bacterium]
MIRAALPLLPFLLLASGPAAQQLTLLLPTGASRGQDVEVRCYGRGLSDTVSVIWFRDGIETLAVEPERDDRVLLRLRVPAACELGSYLFALHTRRGLTRVKALRIGPLPAIAEAADHATRERAQAVDLDVTIDGRILPEDIDWFAFEAKAGQIIRAEVEGVRLGITDLDLQFEIFDPDGGMVVRSDDTALGRADPIATFTAAVAGRHTLALRDVAWRGSAYAAYRLHLGTFPRPTGLLPAGGRPGETVEVQLLGDAEPGTATLTLPQRPGLHEVFPVCAGRPVPTPLRIAVDDRVSFVEGAAPNEAPSEPCAFHGVIAAAGEEDRHAFRAAKGARIELRVLANNLRSTLDPVLTVRDAKGDALATNDDGLGLDARLRFTAPADGTFLACVSDHLGRGSDAGFYRLEIGELAPKATTREAVPGRRSEDLGVAVPIGRRNATMIQVSNLDRRDGVALGFAPLPPGVTATPMRLPAGADLVPIVFAAAADAAIGSRLASPTAAADQGENDRPIGHEHGFPMLRVENNQPYDSRAVRALPIVVTQATPFDIAATAPAVPLVRSGSLTVPVLIERDAGFAVTVTVTALWLPAGLSASTVRLTGDNTAGTMSFNANSRAATGRWPIVLLASATIDGVVQTVCTEVLMFDLQEPWITAKLPRARIEQGGRAVYEIELERNREFEGVVRAELGRVPKGITAEIPEIAAGATKLPIGLLAAADASPGRHRSLYVRLMIETPDGVISHAAGGGELHVDVPLSDELRAAAKAASGGTR